MQTVKINLTPNSIFQEINYLYSVVSSPCDDPDSLVPVTYDSSFEDLFDILEEKVAWFKRPETRTLPAPKPEFQYNPKEIIVCVSGGKDSVATVLHYLNLGFNVYLYHLHGINKVYFDEFESVKKIAEYLNLPFFIDECTLSGNHSFVEHPLKNYIIANGAINWALNSNIAPNIAFGNFSKSRLEDVQFDVCGGDCMNMWSAYNKIISRMIPGFCMRVPLYTQQDTYEILGKNKELIELTQSCISPYRFREHWKQRTEDKYGVKLMPHRCGCCWKDACEYITLTDNGVLTYNESYYEHCLEILGKTMQKEDDVYEIPVTDVWMNYISHDIDKSKLGEKITHGIIRNGKIRYTE